MTEINMVDAIGEPAMYEQKPEVMSNGSRTEEH